MKSYVEAVMRSVEDNKGLKFAVKFKCSCRGAFSLREKHLWNEVLKV